MFLFYKYYVPGFITLHSRFSAEKGSNRSAVTTRSGSGYRYRDLYNTDIQIFFFTISLFYFILYEIKVAFDKGLRKFTCQSPSIPVRSGGVAEPGVPGR